MLSHFIARSVTPINSLLAMKFSEPLKYRNKRYTFLWFAHIIILKSQIPHICIYVCIHRYIAHIVRLLHAATTTTKKNKSNTHKQTVSLSTLALLWWQRPHTTQWISSFKTHCLPRCHWEMGLYVCIRNKMHTVCVCVTSIVATICD